MAKTKAKKMSKAKPKALGRKTKMVSDKVTLGLSLSPAEAKEIRAKAVKLTNGNVSAFLRLSALGLKKER